MERISRFRAMLFLLLFAFVLVLYAGRLFVLQIIETDGNTDNTATYTTITTVRASRGDLLDRNGKVLVGNRASYNLVFNHYVIESYGETNEALYRLVKKCQDLNIEISDHFPVTRKRPFVYEITTLTNAWQNHFQSFMVDRGLDSDITAPLLMQTLRERYKIPEEWNDEDARAVIGMRYEFDLRGISNLPTFTFLEDVSDEHLSALLELNTPGLMVESSTVREYHTEYGAHILGYLGGMDAKDWEKYKDQGYSMDAYIGQSGFEEAFEEYLHGIDGQRVDVVSRDGTIIEQYYRIDKNTGEVYTPRAGNNVETTIDIDIQTVAEQSLADTMSRITDPEINRTTIEDKEGLDAQGAAVIVMKVKTGEVLACASYPTYNLATMRDDWKEIMANEFNPLFNRAFGAAYAPGSTFKMCTLISAMEHRDRYGEWVLNYGEPIEDKGVYNELGGGFAPQCLLWTNSTAVHSNDFTGDPLTGNYAIGYSCNYFFYELGYRLTDAMLAETAQALGLGVPTGIEIPNEEIGRNNTEAVKKEVYKTGVNATFTAGDRVLGGIGQAENRYTPMQLAVYASTLANKGIRMKATFLSRVVSDDYRTLVYENEPVIANQLTLQSTTIDTYMDGMLKVTKLAGGTAAKYFGGYSDQIGQTDTYGDSYGVWPLSKEVTVWAKTGTAEHASGGSDHGAFVCFAAKNGQEPEVAIAIFGEKIAHGASLAPVAEDILQTYFAIVDAGDVTAFENQVS